MELIHILHKLQPGERVVNMIQWRDRVYVATTEAVYLIVDDGAATPTIKPYSYREGRRHVD